MYKRQGVYALHDEIERLFVDKGMLYCGFVNPELVFNIIYRDKNYYPYVKRCKLDKFILNRVYELVSEDCRILQLTTGPDLLATVTYKPTPRMRVFEEVFDLTNFQIRGNRAKGIRLASKAIKSVKLARRVEQSETPLMQSESNSTNLETASEEGSD